jgi:hypothetical protein
MTELVERYVHQIGRYLPQKDRADIEKELRSMIQDQLDDRYQGVPTEADIALVLTELGSPHKMAASYRTEQYLIGPEAYPYMMMVLRHGWLIVPTVVVFVTIFGALISPQPRPAISIIVEVLLSVLQATAIFSGLIVVIFAIIERSNISSDEQLLAFNPLTLPKIDDPYEVDRAESTFGVWFGTLVALVILYFARTASLNPTGLDSAPLLWVIVLLLVAVSLVAIHIVVLRRNRWSSGLWLLETVIGVIGVIGLYYVLYVPIFAKLAAVPALHSIPLIDKGAEIVAVVTASSTLIGRGIRQMKLWNYGQVETVTPPASK